MKYTHGGDIYTTEYRLDFSANICPFGANEAVRQAANSRDGKGDSLSRQSAAGDCGRSWQRHGRFRLSG